jgi:hypothetical protein
MFLKIQWVLFEWEGLPTFVGALKGITLYLHNLGL